MTDAQHEHLAELLHSLSGMVIISSYPGDLYSSLYRDWTKFFWQGSQFCHGAAKRTEAVWVNPAGIAARTQACFDFEILTRSVTTNP